MTRRIPRFAKILAAAALALVAAFSSAEAQSEARGPSFELFGAYVRPTDSDSDFDTEAYGVRGGFRFTNLWALEGSLSKLNEEDADVWFGDLSAKAYFVHSDRFEVYALAGPGFFKVENGGEELTLHLGVGAEIGLGERAYLRPEVRGRWLEEDLRADAGLVDYSVGIGWRF